MRPLILAAALFSFIPSPDALLHLCTAQELWMGWAPPPEGEVITRRRVACSVMGEWDGRTWAQAQCSDQVGTACEICIRGVDFDGVPSACGEIEAYVDDLR